jgi:two-component system chemotaxis response regulator CheB
MPIRVLVVDDAVVFRKGISDALAIDESIQVVGTAANGRLALQKMAHALPDLVVLDVEMPELDGLATLSEIRKQWPKLPVIMCSAHTREGARVTIEALERGANDFVTKPSTGSAAESIAHFRADLLPRIKAHCSSSLMSVSKDTPSRSGAPPVVARSPMMPLAPPIAGRVDLVVIGVSTGGPNALTELITHLPGDLPAPVLIVQHMPAMFTKLLAERLSLKSALPVQEAAPDTPVAPGRIWLAPGGFHMTVGRAGADLRLGLNQDAPENSCRPSVDVLFRSAALATGANTLAVVLTGMGEDGTAGCRNIRAAGGQVVAQDKESSVVWGMPGQVAKAGLAEKLLPITEMAGEIITRLHHGRPAYRSLPRKPPP